MLSLPAAPAASRQQLCEMQCLLVTELLNLLATAETIGQQHCHRTSAFDGRHQPIIRNRLGYVVLAGLKAEWPRHSAAARFNCLNVRARAAQQRDLARRPAEYRLVMAMTVNQNMSSFEMPRRPVRSLICEPVRQQPHLLAHSSGTIIIREKLKQLVLEDACAAWLKEDEWSPLLDLRRHPIQHIRQIRSRMIEKSKIVERPSATEMPFRSLNPEARRMQHSLRCHQRLRMVIVVPRVRP